MNLIVKIHTQGPEEEGEEDDFNFAVYFDFAASFISEEIDRLEGDLKEHGQREDHEPYRRIKVLIGKNLPIT